MFMYILLVERAEISHGGERERGTCRVHARDCGAREHAREFKFRVTVARVSE